MVRHPLALLFQSTLHLFRIGEDDVDDDGVVLLDALVLAGQVARVLNGLPKISRIGETFCGEHLHEPGFTQLEEIRTSAYDVRRRIEDLAVKRLVFFPIGQIRHLPGGVGGPVAERVHESKIILRRHESGRKRHRAQERQHLLLPLLDHLHLTRRRPFDAGLARVGNLD